MANDPTLLRVGASGKAYVAPIGTVAPVSIRSYTAPNTYVPIAFGAGWKDLGLISDDGLKEAIDEKREDWTPWGFLAPVRTQITSETTTFNFTCWETSSQVLSLRYRQSTTSMTYYANNTEVQFDQTQSVAPDLRMFGFDVIDGSNQMRFIIPRGEVTDRDDVTNKSDDVIGYEFTVTAYPDTTGIAIKRFYVAGLVVP